MTHNWRDIARPEQLPPEDDDWKYLAFLGGRGSGMTRAAAETVMELVRDGKASSPLLVGPTTGVLNMVSTIIDNSSPEERPRYDGSCLAWPNGTIAMVIGVVDVLDHRAKGYQSDIVWMDDVGLWGNHAARSLELINLGARSGTPRFIVSSTQRTRCVEDFIVQLVGDDALANFVCNGPRASATLDRHLAPRNLQVDQYALRAALTAIAAHRPAILAAEDPRALYDLALDAVRLAEDALAPARS